MRLYRLRPVMRACCIFAHSFLIPPATTQRACTYKQQVVTKVLVVENPIYINTNVLRNTTFAVNPYLTLTVDDAPTSVDLRTTYTIRKTTIIDHVYSSIASPDSVQKGAQFAIIIGNIRLSHQRRQGGGNYLGSNGLLTTSCQNASAYSLTSGQLFATTYNGAKLQFSASTGNNYITFVPTASPGDITTTFSLTTTGILLWTNSNFFNGNALFCILPSGEILAIFVQNSQPGGCVFIDLTISDLTSCFNPIGPSGPQGLQGPGGVQGPTGVQGIQGSQGIPGPTGAQGIQGSQGVPGQTGVQGIQGSQGIPGPTGAQGPSGISGMIGATGASGISGMIGATGVQGPSGISGLSGISGQAGPTGPTGVALGYLGCYYQSGSPVNTNGRVLANFVATYTTLPNRQCSTYCIAGSYTFAGTVANGTTGGDCYCGNTLNLVQIVGLGTGRTTDNNCGLCGSGFGECGLTASQTVAIFARAF